MNKFMMTAILALTGIIIISSFGLQLMPADAVPEVPEAMAANVLYVCPTASNTWDAMSMTLRQFSRFFEVMLMGSLIVLAFMWGWAFYQNLLKDKFDADKYKTPWEMTKIAFWAVVIIVVCMMTPNFFRTVHINGVEQPFVLCEAGDENARAVRADIISH